MCIRDRLWIQPASGDAGGALGAALALWHKELKNDRQFPIKDEMKGSYLGPSFNDDEIEATLKSLGANYEKFSEEEIKDVLLKSGTWPFILQRPYGVIAQPEDKPKAVYISTYSTSPLGVDFDFILKNKKEDFQLGLTILSKLADILYLTVDSNFHGFFENFKDVSILKVKGPHPAGNIGVQIHNHKPISPGEKVWTVKPEDVSNIGSLFKNGEFCFLIGLYTPMS